MNLSGNCRDYIEIGIMMNNYRNKCVINYTKKISTKILLVEGRKDPHHSLEEAVFNAQLSAVI